jgi:hypothetical protein
MAVITARLAVVMAPVSIATTAVRVRGSDCGKEQPEYSPEKEMNG